MLERQQSTVPADKKCALHHQTDPQAHRHHRASGVGRNTPCECPPASGRSTREARKITADARTTQGEITAHFLPATAERSAPGELIRERQREGVELARRRGAYRGRNRTLSDEQISVLRERVAAGEPKAHLAREFGISRETVYQYLRAQPAATEPSAETAAGSA